MAEESAMQQKTTRTLVWGYTLIELIMVIAIATLTILAVTAALVLFYSTNTKTLNQGYALQSARQGLAQTVADIRGIQYGADGSYPIASIGADSFVFYTDTNGDGIPERVEYYLSGTDLIRGLVFSTTTPPSYNLGTESTATSASYLRNSLEGTSLFHFYNASSAEITTFSASNPVAYVTVTLVVNEDTSTSTGDYTLRSTAALRNASQF